MSKSFYLHEMSLSVLFRLLHLLERVPESSRDFTDQPSLLYPVLGFRGRRQGGGEVKVKLRATSGIMLPSPVSTVQSLQCGIVFSSVFDCQQGLWLVLFCFVGMTTFSDFVRLWGEKESCDLTFTSSSENASQRNLKPASAKQAAGSKGNNRIPGYGAASSFRNGGPASPTQHLCKPLVPETTSSWPHPEPKKQRPAFNSTDI